MRIAITVLFLVGLNLSSTEVSAQPTGDSEQAEKQSLQDIAYVSAADNTKQRAMFFAPKSDLAVPLIVALHTWSGDYTQQYHKAIGEWCIKNGWAYIHPNFRGPNWRPEPFAAGFQQSCRGEGPDFARRHPLFR